MDHLLILDSFKASETLLGIETSRADILPIKPLNCFKASETLLGIETLDQILAKWQQVALQSL